MSLRKARDRLPGFLEATLYRIKPPLVFMVLVVMPFTFMVQRDGVASTVLRDWHGLCFVDQF